MADQFQICENADKESLEITLGYDMDGNAQLASVLQVFLCTHSHGILRTTILLNRSLFFAHSSLDTVLSFFF